MEDNPSGQWTYTDPIGELLVNYEDVVDPCMCDIDAWSYDGFIEGVPGPWAPDPESEFWLLPWLNTGACYGGQPGEVLTYGPLLISWKAPEAADNVEISGHLWQVNNETNVSDDMQIAYTIDHDGSVIASGAVLRSGGVTLSDRDNTIDFDDGDVIIVPHVDADDTINLLIDGSGEYGNGQCYYGYASFRIIIPKCLFDLIGDLNNDCTVDFEDLEVVASNWLTAGEPDYNDDANVSFNDYARLARSWLINCRKDPGNPRCVPIY